MVKAIIFDFFDVIHSDPFNRWLKHHNLPRDGGYEASSQLVDLGHISEQEFYQRLSDLSSTSLKSVQEIFGDTDLVDEDLVEFIKQLHARYALGLLSNSSSEYLRPILAKHGLNELFDAVVISAEVGHSKPSGEIFMHMLRELNVTADEALFIDDNPTNVKAARKLGVESLHYEGLDRLRNELSALKLL